MAVFDLCELDAKGVARRHRLAIADCIMAWAKFESQFRDMLTAVEQRPLDIGARDYDRLNISVGWSKLRKALKARSASDAVLAVVRNHEKSFEHYVDARNIVAHAGCIGVWRPDTEYLVFAPFEAHPDGMTIIRLAIEQLERSSRWALAAAQMAQRIMDVEGQ